MSITQLLFDEFDPGLIFRAELLMPQGQVNVWPVATGLP